MLVFPIPEFFRHLFRHNCELPSRFFLGTNYQDFFTLVFVVDDLAAKYCVTVGGVQVGILLLCGPTYVQSVVSVYVKPEATHT